MYHPIDRIAYTTTFGSPVQGSTLTKIRGCGGRHYLFYELRRVAVINIVQLIEYYPSVRHRKYMECSTEHCLQRKGHDWKEGRKEMFYLTTHSTHFIYGYMASDIWQRTTQIAREETRCRKIGYSFRIAVRVILYASSHIQDNTYHGLCYTSRGALAGTRNSSMGPPPHEGSIRRPIAP